MKEILLLDAEFWFHGGEWYHDLTNATLIDALNNLYEDWSECELTWLEPNEQLMWFALLLSEAVE